MRRIIIIFASVFFVNVTFCRANVIRLMGETSPMDVYVVSILENVVAVMNGFDKSECTLSCLMVAACRYDTDDKLSSISNEQLQNDINHLQNSLASERHTHRMMIGIFIVAMDVLVVVIMLVINTLNDKSELAAKKLIRYYQAREKLKTVNVNSVIDSVSDEKTSSDDGYRNSAPRDANRRQELLSKINDFIENNPAVYSENFLIADLAAALGERVAYISQTINEIYGKNFRSYLNELRIRKACMMLEDKENTKYTIEAIAGKLGFKSRSNFMMNFKKVMGLTPSEYRKIHNSQTEGLSD